MKILEQRRKRNDDRYGVCVETGICLLAGWPYHYPESEIVYDARSRKYPLRPDVYTKDGKVGVCVGILHEKTLLELLKTYEEIVHLPFPSLEKVRERMINYYPTHYRVFRCIARQWDCFKEIMPDHMEVLGSSLTLGRSER